MCRDPVFEARVGLPVTIMAEVDRQWEPIRFRAATKAWHGPAPERADPHCSRMGDLIWSEPRTTVPTVRDRSATTPRAWSVRGTLVPDRKSGSDASPVGEADQTVLLTLRGGCLGTVNEHKFICSLRNILIPDPAKNGMIIFDLWAADDFNIRFEFVRDQIFGFLVPNFDILHGGDPTCNASFLFIFHKCIGHGN